MSTVQSILDRLSHWQLLAGLRQYGPVALIGCGWYELDMSWLIELLFQGLGRLAPPWYF